jgi:PAS domain S-box-containing protein
MPNIAIVSNTDSSTALLRHALKMQMLEAALFRREDYTKVPLTTDIVYIDVQNLMHDLDHVELLVQRYEFIPIVVLLRHESAKSAVKAFHAGASDVVVLTDDITTDCIEVVNSLYRAIRKRHELLSLQLVSENSLPDTFISDAASAAEAAAQRFIRQMEQPVIVMDKSQTIVSLNEAAEKILGRNENTLRGKRLNDCVQIPTDQLSGVMEGNTYRGEVMYQDGAYQLSLGYALSPRAQRDGSFSGAIVLFKDITLEKQRRLQDEKTEKMQTLGEIAAAISHEVKNPLMGIKSLVQAMLLDVEKDSELYEYTKRISREVDRINKFIESTFAFARHRRPKVLRVNMKEIIESVAELLDRKLKENAIQLIVKLQPDMPMVKADPDQIRQVVLNVILNSIEALSQTLPTTMRERKITVTTKDILYFVDGEPQPFLEIAFQDNGSGIPDAILSKIFDPFFTTKPNGTGLGLAICFKILSEHHGKIDVQNAEEGGTIVSLRLPAIAIEKSHQTETPEARSVVV